MGSSSNLPILQDLEKESDTPLQQVSIEEILEEQRVEQQTRLEAEKLKVQALKDRGLSIPRADTLDEYWVLCSREQGLSPGRRTRLTRQTVSVKTDLSYSFTYADMKKSCDFF